MLVHELTDEMQVIGTIARLNAAKQPVVVDLETTGLDSFKDTILEIQLHGLGTESVYVFPARFASALRSLNCRPIGHNLRFDVTFLHRAGVDVTHWQYRDTLLVGHLLDENRDSYSLDAYVQERWGDPYKADFKAKYPGHYSTAPRVEQVAYAAKDVWYTGLLYDQMTRGMAQQGIPPQLVEDVHRLQYALLRTEIAGVKIDQRYLMELGVKLSTQIQDIVPRMKAAVAPQIDFIELSSWSAEIEKRKSDVGKARVPRPEFSFDSGPMLKKLLYEELQLPVQVNDKTKAVSTDFESLEKIKSLHPVVGLIQEYRDAAKLKGTYVDGIMDRARDGRVYPTFRLVDDVSGMKTARISHRDPNLGNFPKQGGVKGIFVPDDGYVLGEFDYTQLEVCIEAHLTQDRNLLKIIMDGASKHDITAAELGIDRALAKTVNFAMQYWAGPPKLAKILGIPLAESQLVYNKYWETYAGCRAFKAKVDRSVWAGEPVQDLFGRRRRLTEIPQWEGDKAFRQAYNFVIQSTGAQILNNSYYLADEGLRRDGLGMGLWTVHDSGLFQLKEATAKEAAVRIERCMIQQGVRSRLTVPLKVDTKVGMKRWGEAT